jgi:hypothetical protein
MSHPPTFKIYKFTYIEMWSNLQQMFDTKKLHNLRSTLIYKFDPIISYLWLMFDTKKYLTIGLVEKKEKILLLFVKFVEIEPPNLWKTIYCPNH